MNKENLLKKLDKATSRAASISIQRGIPIAISNKLVRVGNLFISKNKNNFFDVLTADRTPLYKDILVFDVAVIIAQRYSTGQKSIIKTVLELEEKYSKFHTDMIYYLHAIKIAKEKNDINKMSILEDKFQSAEMQAKELRDKISVFKRVK